MSPILRGRRRRDQQLLQFLAFGMPLDHEKARQALDAAEEARLAWLADHGPGELHDAELGELLETVLRDALAPHAGRPITLGLSSGFDSRPLLRAMRRAGTEPALFTFGCPGSLDFDFVGLLIRRAGLDVELVDTNTAEWSLAAFDEQARTGADLPISPRVVAARLMDAAHPGRVDVHGYLNGALTGNTRPAGRAYRELPDDRVFAMKNDPFALQGLLPARVVAEPLARAAASADRGIGLYRQLDIGYRQAQRIRAAPGEPVDYAYPYADDRWVGYWLNRPEEQLLHQRHWTDFVRGLDDELFFDVRGLSEQGWDFNRARL